MTSAVLAHPGASATPPGDTSAEPAVRRSAFREALDEKLTCTTCALPLHPVATAGGFTTHPGCDLPDVIPDVTDWKCIRLGCDATGPAAGDHDAIARIQQHERTQHPTPRRKARR